MSAADLPLLLTLPFLLVASAFFSGSETALFGLRQQEFALLSRRGGLSAVSTQSLLRNRRHLLITLLLGNMVINVLYFVITSVLVLRSDNALIGAGLSVGSLLSIILFAEVAPKLLASANRVRWCSLFSPALLVVHRLLGVIRGPLSRFVVEPLARVIRPASEPPTLTADELGALLALSHEQQVLGSEEAELLRTVTDLGVWHVDDVMTPRVDVAWLAESANREETLALLREHPYTSIPLCDRSLDTGVAGVLRTNDYLLACELDAPGSPTEFADPPLFVPEQATLDRLLATMRQKGERFAVVVDEFGGVAGVITFSDIVKRLLGGASLQAEPTQHDVPDRLGEEIQVVGDGVWRVSGRLAAHDWHNTFSIVENSRAATVAGLIAQQLGRVPEQGDVTTLGNVRLEVERLRDGAVESILVSLLSAEDMAEKSP